jgi:hypothetical protein
MTKTTIIVMTAVLALASPSLAHAQAPAPPTERAGFANISVGGQFQSHTFTTNNTINVFGENGVVTANQAVGSGFVFDATGGYRVWQKVIVAVGISTFTGKGDAAALASIPDRLRFGSFTNVPVDASDLKQSDVALNFQAMWTLSLTDQFDLAIFGGPSIIRVKQDFPSVAVNATTGAVTTTVETQSKTTGKAGSGGVDLSYKLADRYGVGVFVRYLGGKVDLPAAPKLTIGGVQAGVGIRYHF